MTHPMFVIVKEGSNYKSGTCMLLQSSLTSQQFSALPTWHWSRSDCLVLIVLDWAASVMQCQAGRRPFQVCTDAGDCQVQFIRFRLLVAKPEPVRSTVITAENIQPHGWAMQRWNYLFIWMYNWASLTCLEIAMLKLSMLNVGAHSWTYDIYVKNQAVLILDKWSWRIFLFYISNS